MYVLIVNVDNEEVQEDDGDIAPLSLAILLAAVDHHPP
jgi:hypothetical protein